MAVAKPDTLGLYPHSAPDGTPIPFDIVRAHGLLIKAFTNAASNNIPIPAEADLLVVQATQDCILGIDVAAVLPADGIWTASLLYVPQGVIMIVDHNAATKFGVVRAGSANGTLYVQTIKKWKDLRKAKQFERG